MLSRVGDSFAAVCLVRQFIRPIHIEIDPFFMLLMQETEKVILQVSSPTTRFDIDSPDFNLFNLQFTTHYSELRLI
jgi:hypothetical protein